jgi:hypothetical protein
MAKSKNNFTQVPAKVMSGDTRKNGKAFKKKPKTNVKKGKTVDGYSPAALARRAEKRNQNG